MEQQHITDILGSDYKDYARYVVFNRAIPSFVDGMKPVQRKALFCATKYAKAKAIKVSALSGYMLSEGDYHHGDTSAQEAICVMAQEFMMGMPYFDKDGQFGWLYDKTHGAPRYIKVKMSGWSHLIFQDEAELKIKFSDDGDKIEPEFYLPIIPMFLINGTNGIAVGYSTSSTNLNPLEVTCAVREYLKTGKLQNYNLTPFMNGHTGLWSWFREGFEHVAPWHRKSQNIITIDGLPICWTLAKYKGFLNQLIEQGQISKYVELSTCGKCVFDIHMNAQLIDNLIADNSVGRFFQLIYRLPKDNMVAVMPDTSIKKFDSPIQFIKEFVDFRLKYYVKRKQRLIRDTEYRIKYLQSLMRFIKLVINNEIDLRGKNRRTLEAELKELDIMVQVLNEHLYNLTEDNIKKHEAEIARLLKELDRIQKQTERDMYLADIDSLLVHIKKFYHQEDILNVNNERINRITV